jgi:hypothetical protein
MASSNGHAIDVPGLVPLGIGYIYTDPVHRVTIHFRRLGRKPEPHAEVDVALDTEVSREWLVEGEPINLAGSTKKRELSKTLHERATRFTEAEWRTFLDTGTGALRKAMSHTTVRPKQMVSARPTYRPDRITDLVREGTMNILYGEGGSGKGYLAILGALCVQQGRPLCGLQVRQGDVLYLDWEDDGATFDNRVAVVAAGNGLECEAPHYKRMIGSLAHQVEEILEYIIEQHIVLVIIDSVSKAFPRGDFGSYETTADTMAEITALFPTTWAIDHVASAGRSEDTLAGKPIGGIGKVNATRNQWEVKGHQDPDSCTVYTAVHQTKQNHTARLGEKAFELEFDDPREPTRVTIRTRSIQDIPELAARTSISSQVYHALKQKRTYEDLYDLLEAQGDRKKQNTIQAAVSRFQKKKLVVREVSDGVGDVLRFWRPDARLLF